MPKQKNSAANVSPRTSSGYGYSILGVNAYHGDSSACLVRDGRLVAAVEEERFRRVKHWAGFPAESVRYCLKEAGLAPGDIDHVALNRNPGANLLKKALFAFSKRPNLEAVRDRLKNASKIKDIRPSLAAALGVPPGALRAQFHNVEHHRAHLASAFFVSGFDSAAVVSVDGFGDFVSAMWGEGEGKDLSVRDEVCFPHSLGLFYLAVTQHLGFWRYGDEYKVMGLAAYGEPRVLDKMREIVPLGKNGGFALNLDYFVHHSEGVSMLWDEGEPKLGPAFSKKMEEAFGPAREPDGPVTDRHKDIAASAQAMYEEAFFHLLCHVHRETKKETLCLAGGCAMNSVANGKIFEKTPFRKLYVQAAAGDAGGAIGAAFDVRHSLLKEPRAFKMDHAYWGPAYGEGDIRKTLESKKEGLGAERCRIEVIADEARLCRRAAEAVAAGKIVGWFQGRMEWGPRALGNRSIVCDPRRADMKDILNLKIKRRESFRPFAPSVLRERVADWFETDYEVPFMLQVYPIREEKRGEIPAVTHVNGSGRLQTVTREQNPRYYRLIEAFETLTGVPMVLNTSFNENEPIVCRPEEALDCFLRTRMDVLVLGNHVIERSASGP
ncbi:MAG: carbamoyltransferase [Candidatus Omnitrophica bacterium]|nr:carbamoyltransferase [Candidatus Omnitrophota bacterium]